MNGLKQRSLWFGIVLLACIINPTVRASDDGTAQKRWILITLDGVMRTDLCDPRIFSQAWSRLRTELAWSGCSRAHAPSKISNTSAKSLPAYRSMMLGRPESTCTDNFCGRIQEPSILERLRAARGWSKEQVAVFGSWPKIGDAAAQRSENIQINVGTQAAVLPSVDVQARARVAELNRLQSKDAPPWSNSWFSPTRWDRFTWEQALIYRGAVDPKVLWIALDDSDEWAHRGDRNRYIETLKTYDGWLVALMAQVQREDLVRGTETRVMITTDHGRALGAGWTDHDASDGESPYIWMLERAPGGAVGDEVRVEPHLWIRQALTQSMGNFVRPRKTE